MFIYTAKAWRLPASLLVIATLDTPRVASTPQSNALTSTHCQKSYFFPLSVYLLGLEFCGGEDPD